MSGYSNSQVCCCDVARDIDEHGAGPAGRRDVERLADRRGDVLDVEHERVVLRDRDRDAGDVGFLEAVAADAASVTTWPVMQTSGTESIQALAMPVTRFVAPGPEVAQQTPALPVTRA